MKGILMRPLLRTGALLTLALAATFAVSLAAQDTPKRPGAAASAKEEAREVEKSLRELLDAAIKDGRRPRTPNAAMLGPPLEPKDSTGLVPLPELGKGLYLGKPGGHYPGGKNERPTAHDAAGLRLAREVVSRDPNGRPDDSGTIVLLSIGMSNTTQEFSTFQRLAASESGLNPKLKLVDGAQGGMTAAVVSDPESPRGGQFWKTVAGRLDDARVTPAQVQAVWLKEADAAPSAQFPVYPEQLRDEMGKIARILHERFGNLKLVFLSSRTYGGFATTRLNPEPFAYQSGFAVKWLIERQIEGAPDLNFDPARGPVKAPWLAWGPDLWADGVKPRQDGFSYVKSDFGADGTHPSPAGREKVARLLLDFFKSDSATKPWFLDVK
jgi:hypothetical protein